MTMDMISVRQAPELAPRAIAYFQRHWATAETLMMYEDAINRSPRRRQPAAAVVPADGK